MKTKDMLYVPGPALGYDEVYEAACEADAAFESHLNWFYENAKYDYDNDRFEAIDLLIENALDSIYSSTIKIERFNRLLFGLIIKQSSKDVSQVVSELQDMIREEVEAVIRDKE